MPRTVGDGSLEQRLPLLEVAGIAPEQQSGMRGPHTREFLREVGEDLELLSQILLYQRIPPCQMLCTT